MCARQEVFSHVLRFQHGQGNTRFWVAFEIDQTKLPKFMEQLAQSQSALDVERDPGPHLLCQGTALKRMPGTQQQPDGRRHQ